MRISNVVLGAILLMGMTAHADLSAEFSRAQNQAQQKAQQQQQKDLQHAQQQQRNQRMEQVVKYLGRLGMDRKVMKVELAVEGGLSLCSYGICGPEIETYFAKQGNVVCKVIASFEDKLSSFSHACYDTQNPQPTEVDMKSWIISL